jgi:hypothetical protein
LDVLTKHGEEIQIGGSTIRGFFQPLDSFRTHLYLDDTEAQAVVKPGLFLITHADASININDTVTRDGRIYTIRKVALERLGDTAVLKCAVLS